jgi:Bacterial Ig-like domain
VCRLTQTKRTSCKTTIMHHTTTHTIYSRFYVQYIASAWLVVLLTACLGSKPELALTIAKPTADLATNTNVPVTLEIPGHTPDQFTALNIVLERKRASDPDTAYAPIATFDRNSPYPFTTTWDIKGEADGAYALRARATYTSGGFSSDTLSSVSQPRGVTLDRQVPMITDRLPLPDAKNVSVKSLIRVTFSKPIRVSSLTDASVKLSNKGVDLPRTLALSADGKTLTITPGSVLNAPTTLSIAISDAITDVVGNKFSSAVSWSWDEPTFYRIGDPLGTVKAVQPSLALDSNGYPIVAFIDLDGTVSRVFVQRWDGSNWKALGGALSTTPGDTRGVNSPQVRVDSSGRPVVAWVQSDSATANSFRTFVRRWDGSSWQDLGGPRSSPTPPSTSTYPLSLALDGAGNPVIAASPNDATYRLWVDHRDVSNWKTFDEGLSGRSDADKDGPSNPSLALDATGFPVVVWRQTPASLIGSSINASRIEPNRNQWLRLPSLPESYNYESTSLAVGTDNIPVVAWHEYNGVESLVFAANLTSSGWQKLGTDLSAVTGNSFARDPTIALDSSNNPVVAWTESIAPSVGFPSLYDVFISRWNGSTWVQLGGPLSAIPGLTDAENVRLALDSSNTPVLAWSEKDGSGSKVYVYRQNR